MASTTKPKLPSLRYLCVEYLGCPDKGSSISTLARMRGYGPKRQACFPCCSMDVLAFANPTPLSAAAVRKMHCTIVKISDAVYGYRASPVIAWVHQKLPEQLLLGSIRNTVHKGRQPSVRSYVIRCNRLWLHTCNLDRTRSAPAVACLGKVTRKLPAAVHVPCYSPSLSRHEASGRLYTPCRHVPCVACWPHRLRFTRKRLQVLHVSSGFDQASRHKAEAQTRMTAQGAC